MNKVIIFICVIFLSNSICSQNYRMRKNEFGVNIFTAYDFDKFSIINRHQLYVKNLPINMGFGLSFERILTKNYYIKAKICHWQPYLDKPILEYESIIYKDANFFGLGLGKRMTEGKLIRTKINSQLIFRRGYLQSYAGSHHLFTHYYNDLGISLAGDGQIKITRFLAFNLSAEYIFYFIKEDHETRYIDKKAFVPRHSIMLHSGISVLF